MKARIIERTAPDDKLTYVIQQKHFLLRWMWVDASMNSIFCRDAFNTLERAKENLCWFNGTKTKERVIE